jgi:hypothetical protein
MEKAAQEDGAIVSVGGLVTDLGVITSGKPEAEREG